MMDFLQAHEMIKVCPEVLGGLKIFESSEKSLKKGECIFNSGKFSCLQYHMSEILPVI